jgi:ABC-type uncharacterized transport system permease subunit
MDDGKKKDIGYRMIETTTIRQSRKFTDQLIELARRNTGLISMLISVLAIVAALLIGAVLIAFAGINPWVAYGYLIKGCFGTLYGFGETLNRFVPLVFTGFAFAVSIRSGFFNVGAEGQLYVGALGAVLAGIYLKGLNPVLHITLSLLAGFVGGALWANIAGILKVTIGANEMINNLMLNYIATLLIQFLVNGPLKDPNTQAYQTPPILESAKLPVILPNTHLHFGFILALLAAFGVYYFLWRTPMGFMLRTIGWNPKAAACAGMNPVLGTIIAVIVSGGLAGLAGANEILGSQYRLVASFSSGFGFDGIGVAVMGQCNPVGVLLSAYLFAIIRVGAGAMQRGVGVPSPLLSVIQGLIIIFVVTSAYFTNKLTTTVIGGRA